LVGDDSSATAAFELLLAQTTTPLSRLTDMRLARQPQAEPAAVFRVLSGWLDSAWQISSAEEVCRRGEEESEVPMLTIQELSGPAVLIGPAQLRSVLRFESTEMIRLRDLPGLDKALSCSIEAVVASATREQTRQDAMARIGLQVLGMVSFLSFPKRTCR
jgi:hypothetical protein